MRRTKIRTSLLIHGWEVGEVEEDLGELANMFGGNQLGCQYPIWVCESMKEFARGGEVAISLGNGRVSRREMAEVEEIRSEEYRDPSGVKIALGVGNGRGSGDLEKMVGSERPNWLDPNMILGGNQIGGYRGNYMDRKCIRG